MAIEFEIHDRPVGEDAHIVAVRGEIDLFTAPEFKQRVTAPIDAGRSRVVVDLSQTTFIDSSSLGVLIGAHRRLLRRGGAEALVVDAAVPGVGNVIEQLADELQIDPDGDREFLRVRLAYAGAGAA